jgi:hypothetical protein
MNRFESEFFCFFESFLELCDRLDNAGERDFSEEESMVERFLLVRREKCCDDGEIDRWFTDRETMRDIHIHIIRVEIYTTEFGDSRQE